MIQRYWGPEMRALWETSLAKFKYWLQVEVAVLRVREEKGDIPAGTTARVSEGTWVDEQVVELIETRDRKIGHDLNAFVEIMRLQLILGRREFLAAALLFVNDDEVNEWAASRLKRIGDYPDASYFHDGMTSYDTEEPAMSLLVLDSYRIVRRGLDALGIVLRERALRHKGQLMIGRTHGQHAQPITFGVKILNWRDMVLRAKKDLEEVAERARVMKLSGAVGMFGTLPPEIEQGVGELLDLEPVIATQIVALDRRAKVVVQLAVISGILEKIANDLWLMAQTEVGEIREPFGKSQKGSSAMPHKKNPIGIENIRGCSSAVRGYAMTMLELIATSHERDISHSAPERLVVADAFGVVDHQLRKLTSIIRDMDVFPDMMLRNLELTRGLIASQRLEMILKEQGMAAETAYRIVQAACSKAVCEGRHLRDVILEDEEARALLPGSRDFAQVFHWLSWVAEENYIYAQQGIYD